MYVGNKDKLICNLIIFQKVTFLFGAKVIRKRIFRE